MARDYYEILGINRSASQDEIRQAFHRRAREIHPDVNPSPDATKRFQELNAAYQVLSNPVRRSVYDRMSAVAHPYRRPASPPPANPPASSSTWQPSRPSTTYWRAHSQTDYPEYESHAAPAARHNAPLTFKVWFAQMALDFLSKLTGIPGCLAVGILVAVIPCAQSIMVFQLAQSYHIEWLLASGNALWAALGLQLVEIAVVVAIAWALHRPKSS